MAMFMKVFGDMESLTASVSSISCLIKPTVFVSNKMGVVVVVLIVEKELLTSVL